MVVKHYDSNGKIDAYGEFRIVDSEGKEDKYGTWAWINDVWIHPSLRRRGFNMILRSFIENEHKKLPWVTFIYWTRGKHGGRKSCYEIRRMLHESLQTV